MPRRPYAPRYGFWNLVLDIILLSMTGGLWAFWIVIREWRYRR